MRGTPRLLIWISLESVVTNIQQMINKSLYKLNFFISLDFEIDIFNFVCVTKTYMFSFMLFCSTGQRSEQQPLCPEIIFIG